MTRQELRGLLAVANGHIRDLEAELRGLRPLGEAALDFVKQSDALVAKHRPALIPAWDLLQLPRPLHRAARAFAQFNSWPR